MATKRRNRAIEMLEASLAPKAPGVSAANKGRESGEHSDKTKGPLHAKTHGRDTATPLAKRSSDNDSTAHTPSTKFSSVYLPIGAPEIDRQPFDLEQLIEQRIGHLGKNVYQTKVADKVLVLEAQASSLLNSKRKRQKESERSKANGKGVSRVRYDPVEFAEQFGFSPGQSGRKRRKGDMGEKCLDPESSEHRVLQAKKGATALGAEDSDGEKAMQNLESLASMWNEYMRAQLRASRGDRRIQVKGPGKTDWHGARASVVAAQNPTLVGLQGIIVRETANTLVLACAHKKKLLQVPKAGSKLHILVGDLDGGARGAAKAGSRVIVLNASSLMY